MGTDPAPAKRPAVYRSRFFVASLWAALIPVALLAGGCLVVMLLPEGNKIVDMARRSAGITLILVPFFYTGLVITDYGIGRLLHQIKLLSRISLVATGGILSLVVAGIVSSANAELELLPVNNTILFVAILAGGTLALAAGALVWWRVASRLPPPPEKKDRSRRRRSSRESAGEPEEV